MSLFLGMLVLDIAGTSRVCAASGRSLRPGEIVHSVLFEREGKLHRHDYGTEAWTGPPEGAYAWWQAKAQPGDAVVVPIVDEALAVETFIRMEGTSDAEQLSMRYVLALWLIRKRKLRMLETERVDGIDWILCKEPRGKAIYRVMDPRMDETGITQAQTNLEKMLWAA